MRADKVIREMDSTLKPLGFVRRKASWNRTVGSFVDVVDLQSSKSGDRVSVGVGVLAPKVFELCWGESPKPFIGEPDCTVRTRLHDLASGNELWWVADDPGTPEEVSARVRSQGLPFIEEMHSLASMHRFLANAASSARPYPPPLIYHAILEAEQGDPSRACNSLRQLRSRTSESWQSKIDGVMKRLSCES